MIHALDNHGWVSDDGELFVANIPKISVAATEKNWRKYIDFLGRWRTCPHPSILPIRDIQIVDQSLIDGGGSVTLTVAPMDIAGFLPIQKVANCLLPFDQLTVLQQTIHLIASIEPNLSTQHRWRLQELYYHPAGLCRWLPPSPACWLMGSDDVKVHPPMAGFVRLVCNLTAIEMPTTAQGWRELMRNGTMPQEWITILSNWDKMVDAAQNGVVDPVIAFKFLFYHAPCYGMAAKFAMKDLQMSADEFGQLRTLAKHIGLTEAQAKAIEVVSQKSELDWDSLISSFRAI